MDVAIIIGTYLVYSIFEKREKVSRVCRVLLVCYIPFILIYMAEDIIAPKKRPFKISEDPEVSYYNNQTYRLMTDREPFYSNLNIKGNAKRITLRWGAELSLISGPHFPDSEYRVYGDEYRKGWYYFEIIKANETGATVKDKYDQDVLWTKGYVPTAIAERVLTPINIPKSKGPFRNQFINAWSKYRVIRDFEVIGSENQNTRAEKGEEYVIFPDPIIGYRSNEYAAQPTNSRIYEKFDTVYLHFRERDIYFNMQEIPSDYTPTLAFDSPGLYITSWRPIVYRLPRGFNALNRENNSLDPGALIAYTGLAMTYDNCEYLEFIFIEFTDEYVRGLKEHPVGPFYIKRDDISIIKLRKVGEYQPE